MTELLLNATTSGKTTFLADGDIIFKNIGGVIDSKNNFHHQFDAGAGYKVVMEIKNDWEITGSIGPQDTEIKSNEVETIYGSISLDLSTSTIIDGLYDRLGFRTKETIGSDWVNGNVPWFIKTLQTDMGEDVWGYEYGSLSDGWVLPPNPSTVDDSTISGNIVNSFIPINYVGDAQIISWHFLSNIGAKGR